MARRKRVLNDGETDSSAGRSDDDNIDFDNDPDLKDERELFQDPYRRKRRRKNCKDDAIYMVYLETTVTTRIAPSAVLRLVLERIGQRLLHSYRARRNSS